MKKLKVGVIGCGVISDIYIKNCMTIFKNTEIIACADRLDEKAREKAALYGIKHMTVDELMSYEGIDAVLNLTIPASHYEISKKALLAGKHVYSEKPLALNVSEGLELVQIAAQKGLRIGCAPDTFLGAAVQTAIKLVNDGWIGTPVGAHAFYMARGHEHWHPSPEFYYQAGGGPMFDMGPYYLTAMVGILGAVDSVVGVAKTTQVQRQILVGERAGELFSVETPTYISSLLNFDCGVTATFTATFDLNYQYFEANLPFIEIYGTEGTVSLPDPNYFGGPVKLRRDGDFHEVPLVSAVTENLRGIGLSDMADAIFNNRPVRAGGDLALHVLEIMEGILVSSETMEFTKMQNKCGRPTEINFQ